jgi:hypothetical protein
MGALARSIAPDAASDCVEMDQKTRNMQLAVCGGKNIKTFCTTLIFEREVSSSSSSVAAPHQSQANLMAMSPGIPFGQVAISARSL